MAALKTGARLLPTTFAEDERGWSDTALDALPEGFRVHRDYRSFSKYGVVRGLHYGRVAKLVRCVGGAILDYVVDLRIESFGAVDVIPLAGTMSENPYLYVPPWCAHGYAAVHDARVYYLFDGPREDEGSILWSSIDARWPFHKPTLSERDRNAKPLAEAKRYLCI
jgi:dTDP-4-dehydrorhamnose 3,5-epimerase